MEQQPPCCLSDRPFTLSHLHAATAQILTSSLQGIDWFYVCTPCPSVRRRRCRLSPGCTTWHLFLPFSDPTLLFLLCSPPSPTCPTGEAAQVRLQGKKNTLTPTLGFFCSNARRWSAGPTLRISVWSAWTRPSPQSAFLFECFDIPGNE